MFFKNILLPDYLELALYNNIKFQKFRCHIDNESARAELIDYVFKNKQKFIIELFNAIEENDPQRMMLILASAISTEVRNSQWMTPLQYAVNHNYKNGIEILLAHNADINAIIEIIPEEEWNQIISKNDKYFIDYDAGSMSTNDYIRLMVEVDNELDAFMQRVDKLHEKTKLLKKQILADSSGIFIYAGQNYYSCSALHIAVEKNNPEMVEFILEKGADLTAITHFKDTALHIAVRHNFGKLAEQLIHAGVPLNQKNSFNQTALQIAIRYDYKTLQKLLVDFGADCAMALQTQPSHSDSLIDSRHNESSIQEEYKEIYQRLAAVKADLEKLRKQFGASLMQQENYHGQQGEFFPLPKPKERKLLSKEEEQSDEDYCFYLD